MATRPRPEKPGFSFPGVVPKEALDYLKHKGYQPGFSHLDVFREEHAYHFTVAKAMQLDVLRTIRAEVERVKAEGRTFAQYKKELTPALQKLGWWGVQEVEDPLTGKKQLVELGSPRRLKVIFETNMRTARSAGQWERIERTKDSLPYLLYLLGPSKEHRPEHAQWHGTLLPVDDPWWQSHSTPNGWGCKCHVRQVSEYEAGRLKERGVIAPDRKQLINPETGLPTGHIEKRYTPVRTEAPPIRTGEWVNKRTGEVLDVPVGIDPGFDTNPGKERQQNLERMLAGKLSGAPRDLVQVAMRDLAASGRYRAWAEEVLAEGRPRGYVQIVGAIDGSIAEYLAARDITVGTPVIEIDDKAVLHGRRAAKADRAAALPDNDLLALPERLAEAERYFDEQDPALVYAWESGGGKAGKAVVRVNFRKKGEVSNRVVTTGLVQPGNLRDPRYKKIP